MNFLFYLRYAFSYILFSVVSEELSMFRYLAKRLLIMIPTIMAIVMLAMLLLSLVPGTGIMSISSYSSQGDFLDPILESLKLHGTFFGRYFRFFVNIFKGDFGSVRQTGILMTVEFPARIWHTCLITLSGILTAFLFGVPLGFLAALKKNRPADHLVTAGTLLLSSIPSYCFAVILTIIFVVWLRLLPLTGYKTPAHFILPALVSAAPGIATITSITRSSVLRVLGEPYITLLRAEGMHYSRIICRYVTKNAFVIFMASFQNIAISILCSGMIAENFFSIPGLGVLLVNAVSNRSAYLCMVCLVVFSILILFLSLICDCLCLLVDPQLRKQVTKGGR